jgi:uncharacterized membrane-anchored protein
MNRAHPALLAALLLAVPAVAQTPPSDPPPTEAAAPEAAEDEVAPEALPPGMVAGPATAKLGSQAELRVGDDSIFGDASAAKRILEESGNLTSGRELGILLGKDATVIFEFDEVGYVKDDDKDALDADKMLASLREGQDAANEELKRLGRPELELSGWQVKPHYDEATHNLEWAPLVRNKANGNETVNYNVRILGRRGVTEATLLVTPDKFQAQLPWFREALKGFQYASGEDYASFRQGDKIAEYGLAALVTGGVVAAAAKSGILARLWKLIVLGVVALGGLLKRLFGGGKTEEASVVQADQQGNDTRQG